ncbi:unnamed protein product [Rotaria sordida]|uniref:Uncharacterized protein n=2 Tax=Rotaria sordida TaxID=392033 RepID=A0A813UT56_9BILA|nr:unnamed protein product [Rotaria sordida]
MEGDICQKQRSCLKSNSPIAITANDNVLDTIDFDFQTTVEHLQFKVHQCALRNIIRLCKIERSACDIRAVIHKILLKARLPLWPSSATTRSSNQKLLSQSIEYFDLRCQLTEKFNKTNANNT